MKIGSKIFLGLFTIFGIIWLLIWCFSNLSADWLPFIAAGVGFLVSRLYETWKENKTRLYEKKREVYARLLKPWQSILIGTITSKSKEVDPALAPELIAEAANAAFDAILYASDDVIKSYGSFRTITAVPNVTAAMILSSLTGLLKSIRKDLGNTYSNLTDIEILQMFMNLTLEEKQQIIAVSKIK